MKLLRFLAAAVLAGAALLSSSLAVATDAYPSRPIHVVVPFPPGGLTDASIRKLAELVTPDLGQPFVLENKPGANGLIGTSQALRAPADGYTLIAVTTSVVVISPILSKASFDPLKDLSYLLNYAGPLHALIVRADSPYKTLDDLIADAKARPGQLTFGTVGTSDAAYFGAIALSRAKGVTFNHIPYQGASHSLLSVISGQTVFGPTSNYSEMVKAGKVRPLVLLDKEWLASLPGVPTFTRAVSQAKARGIVGEADLPKMPLRRLGTVEDMTGPLEFLATDLSSYVTGQCISACGGKVLTPS